MLGCAIRPRSASARPLPDSTFATREADVLVMGPDGIPVASDPRSSADPPEPLMPPKTLFVLVNSPFVMGPGRVAEVGQTLEIPYHFARELISSNKVIEAEDPALAAAAAQAVKERNAAAKENL